MKKSQTLKRNNLIVEYILEHKGVENIVSCNNIISHLKKSGYELKPQSLHSLIGTIIRERHLPICSLNSKGYYWAKTKQDILDCIAHLQARINSLQDHIAHLRNFIIE